MTGEEILVFESPLKNILVYWIYFFTELNLLMNWGGGWMGKMNFWKSNVFEGVSDSCRIRLSWKYRIIDTKFVPQLPSVEISRYLSVSSSEMKFRWSFFSCCCLLFLMMAPLPKRRIKMINWTEILGSASLQEGGDRSFDYLQFGLIIGRKPQVKRFLSIDRSVLKDHIYAV